MKYLKKIFEQSSSDIVIEMDEDEFFEFEEGHERVSFDSVDVDYITQLFKEKYTNSRFKYNEENSTIWIEDPNSINFGKANNNFDDVSDSESYIGIFKFEDDWWVYFFENSTPMNDEFVAFLCDGKEGLEYFVRTIMSQWG